MIRTPHIDALAAQVIMDTPILFVNSVCMSNRATFMTGRTRSLHGVRHNAIPLNFDQSTFVYLLRVASYRSALIGKSHL